MKSVSRIALGVALALGGASVVATSPAEAQKKGKKAQPAAQAGQRALNMSKAERAALEPLRAAVAAQQWEVALAALPAAQAASQGTDARYFTADMMLRIGLGKNDKALQSQAVDAVLASGGAPANALPNLYKVQAAFANDAGNKQKAEASYRKAAELAPTDAEILIDLAKVQNELRRPQDAVATLDRAIAVKKASGQPVHESWYKYALKLAFDGKMRPQALKLSRDLVAAYPTKENWRDVALIYRDVTALDAEAQLDLLRFLRASQSLAGERDWYDLAYETQKVGLFGEAKAALDEAVRLKMVDPNKAAFRDLSNQVTQRARGDRASLATEEAGALADPTGRKALKIADAYAGYGDYAKAITLYRAALGKPGMDSSLVNMRLGAALLAAGNRAEAEAAFRAVTGPRADLAGFWLAWMARSSV